MNRRCCRCPNAIWYHDTISERTDCRGASCKTGNRICRADSKLDSICFAIKQKSQLHNRSGRRFATAFFCILQKKLLPPYFISRKYSLSISKSIYSFIVIDNRNILCYYTHVIDVCAVHRNADRMVCAWGFSHCTRWSGLYLSAGSMIFARKGRCRCRHFLYRYLCRWQKGVLWQKQVSSG